MKTICLALSLLVTVAGCATVQVSQEYSEATDFSALKTYAWLSAADSPSDDVRMNSDLVRQSVRSGVDKVLADKGYTMTARESADFLVTWFGAIEQKLKAERIEHFYAPYGYGTLYRDANWNTAQSTGQTSEYEEGQIIVDFLDPERKSLIWRGTGSGKITPGLPEATVRRNIEKGVAAILAAFPPN